MALLTVFINLYKKSNIKYLLCLNYFLIVLLIFYKFMNRLYYVIQKPTRKYKKYQNFTKSLKLKSSSYSLLESMKQM